MDAISSSRTFISISSKLHDCGRSGRNLLTRVSVSGDLSLPLDRCARFTTLPVAGDLQAMTEVDRGLQVELSQGLGLEVGEGGIIGRRVVVWSSSDSQAPI